MYYRNLSKILLPAIVILLTLFSCGSNDEPIGAKGRLQFNLKENDRSEGGRKKELVPAAVLVSIQNASGYLVQNFTRLDLYGVGEGFVSTNLELPVGNYQLIQFIVLDANDDPIYIAPIEGSDFAQFVLDPLPIDFSVTEDGTTPVLVEVLAIEGTDTPSVFGYTSFEIKIVTPAKEYPVNIAGFIKENFKSEPTAFKLLIKGYKFDLDGNVLPDIWEKEFDILKEGTTIYFDSAYHQFELYGQDPSFVTNAYADYVLYREEFTLNPEPYALNLYFLRKKTLLSSITSDVLAGANYQVSKSQYMVGSRGYINWTYQYYKPDPNNWQYAEAYKYSIQYSPYLNPNTFYYSFPSSKSSLIYTSNEEFPSSITATSNASVELNNHSIWLGWTDHLITSATVVDHDYNNNFSHTYVYDSDGDLITMEITNANDEIIYQANFSYDPQANVIPLHEMLNWVESHRSQWHTDFTIVPFLLTAPKKNLSYVEINRFYNGAKWYTDKATYAYQYNANGLPSGLEVSLNYVNYLDNINTNLISRKNTSFTYIY